MTSKKYKSITIDTYNDHRIALSFSPLVLLGWQLKINNPEVIKKSYPNFWCDLVKFGVKIKNQIRYFYYQIREYEYY